MKKLFALVLSLVLVFGAVGASAADLSLGTDVLQEDTSFVRLGVEQFFGEFEFNGGNKYIGGKGNVFDPKSPENDYNIPKNSEEGITGFSLGFTADTESPFYGLGLLNFTKTYDYKSGTGEDTVWDDPYFDYESLEFGGGAKFQTLWGVKSGMEITLRSSNLTKFSNYRPKVLIFAEVNFDTLPSPGE